MTKLRLLLWFLLFGTIVLFLMIYNMLTQETQSHQKLIHDSVSSEKMIEDDKYNLWIIFTKVIKLSPLYFNFKRLIKNIVTISSVPINFHFIVDTESEKLALDELNKVSNRTNRTLSYKFYDVKVLSESIRGIVDTMKPYFSSEPGTYYSDALFYISLGLHKVAPDDQKLAVMVDCDVHFKKDLKELFLQFNNFRETNLIGLAPELSPVYKHILHTYKTKHKDTMFGQHLQSTPYPTVTSIPLKSLDYLHRYGYQGYNSGVMLFNLSALRLNDEYNALIGNETTVKDWTEKYTFRGHLGDQDFYTLMGFERPHLVHRLDCAFNRQLCTWWRDNGGYKAIFGEYFKCTNDPVVLHGNCNTRIPVD